MKELDLKLGRIQDLLDAQGLDALLLRQVDSFAWATCGASSYVNTAATDGAAALLFTRSHRYVIADNIEAPRLIREERLEEQGWEFQVPAWFDKDGTVAQLTAGLKVGADGAFPGALDVSRLLSRLRAALTPEEQERFRELAKICAATMNAAIRSIHPGMSEHEIAARLANEAENRAIQAIVNLVGTDERLLHFRHPLPTAKRLERYAMLVLCGRKWGLVCSLTRLIHFGTLPDELRAKARATAEVDAHFIAGTRPGRRLRDVFQDAVESYKTVGYPDEWRLHHQGGLAGYAPREIVATPKTDDVVQAGQAYAWNPSIAGTKSEDTILVGEVENEILTAMPGWPAIQVSLNAHTWERPAILEIT